MRDTQMAERLRLFGCPVKETNGWTTRGAEMGTIYGSGNHHTASAVGSSATASLSICIGGRSDLPGPLCNGLQSRDGYIYVVAAGRANHGGVGSWHGRSGNSHNWGLEVEYAGTLTSSGRLAEPFSKARFDLGARWHASLAYAHGYGADEVWQHFQYAQPHGRKQDLLVQALNQWGGVQGYCDLIQHYRDHPPFKTIEAPKPPPYRLDRVLHIGDRDSATNKIVTRVEQLLLWNAEKWGFTGHRPGKVDGVYTTATAASVDAFRHWWWEHVDLPRPASQRFFTGPTGTTVGPKVYDALVWAAVAPRTLDLA